MSREFTLFQFDVDEETARQILSSIPGVTPLPPEDQETAERSRTSAEDERRPTGSETKGGSSTGERHTASDEQSGTTAGVESHLDEPQATAASESTSATERQANATKWAAPSTPWPGAPMDEKEEDGGIVARLRSKKALIAGGVVAVLAAVGAAVYFLKFRDSGDSSGRKPEPPEREPHAEDDDSRSYPVDASPVVGIVFLVVSTVIRRRFGAEDGD